MKLMRRVVGRRKHEEHQREGNTLTMAPAVHRIPRSMEEVPVDDGSATKEAVFFSSPKPHFSAKTAVGQGKQKKKSDELDKYFSTGPRFKLKGANGEEDVEFEPPCKKRQQQQPGKLVIFKRHNIKLCTPSQLVTIVEEHDVSTDGMRRALQFKPQDGDVLVCSAPRSGEGIVLCMVDLLSRKGEGLSLKGDRPDASKICLPWIECVDYDAAPERLDDLQDGSLRVYKTYMSCRAVKDKLRSAGKFIAVCRDPKDYRLAYFKHLERVYEFERNGSPAMPDFVSRFDLDDFALVDTPFVNGYEGKVSYERNMLDWVEASKQHSNVHVVFYEDIIDNTPRVLEELAAFLELSIPPSAMEAIRNHVRCNKMRAHYSPFHVFNAEDALIQVSTGADRLSRKANVKLNQKWNLDVRSLASQYLEYPELYAAATGRLYPFEFSAFGESYQDYLCTDFLDCIYYSLFPRKKATPDGTKKLLRNRMSSWV